MGMTHPNRSNAKKKKQGCGCKLCKPHKGKWQPRFKDKDRLKMREGARV